MELADLQRIVEEHDPGVEIGVEGWGWISCEIVAPEAGRASIGL